MGAGDNFFHFFIAKIPVVAGSVFYEGELKFVL